MLTGTIALTLLGGTAAAFVAFAPPTIAPQTARCYSTIPNDEADTFPGTSVTLTVPSDGTQVEFNALEQCSAIWRTAGMVASQARAVHHGVVYDMEVDTTTNFPLQSARKVLDVINRP